MLLFTNYCFFMSKVTWVDILLHRKELLQNGKGDLAIVDQQVYSRILITVLSVVESVAHRAIQYCVNGWTLPDDNTNLPEGEKIMLMKAVLEIFTQRNLMIWHLHDFLNSQEIVIIWIVSNICIVFLLPVFAWPLRSGKLKLPERFTNFKYASSCSFNGDRSYSK